MYVPAPAIPLKGVFVRPLSNDLGFWYGGKLAAIAAPDSETALRRSEVLREDLDALIEQGAFRRYDMAASFLPSQSRQKSQIRAIPDELELRQRLAAAIADSPLRKDVFEPFIKQAQQARQQPLLTVESLGQSPMGERLKSLLFEHNDIWVALILLHGVVDENALQALNKDEGDVQVLYLNVLASAEGILEKALDRITPLLVAGVGMIYLLLAFAFRSVTRPLFILLPTLSAVAATMAILNLSGIPMTLMHLVSLLLIIGLGLDYSLFYNRLNDFANEWDTTFRALWVCAFTTVLVFGILVISRTPPLQAIGATVGIGVTLSLILGACWTQKTVRH